MKQYRPNVAALMVNSRGQLLICERFKMPNSWQFPQGGVDPEEDLDFALRREVEEEIGLDSSTFEIMKSLGGYRYDYPAKVVANKPPHKRKYAGQEQTYYLCRVKEDYPHLDLMREPREFSQAKWIYPEEFQIYWLPDFKKEVYREVLRDFFSVEI